MPNKKKKKRLKKGFIIILFILMFIGLFVIFYYAFPQNIRNIYVYNNKYLSDQEVIESAKIEDYPNTFKYSTKKIKNNLLKNPYIKSVKVKKKFLYIINITVEENKVLFIRLDTNKIVFENKNEIDYNKEVLGVPYLINYVPNTKYESLIKKLSKIDDDILSKVSEIKYDPNDYDEDRFLLYMNDDNRVYVTLTKFDLLNKYNETIPQLEGKKGILYFDSGNYFEILK